MNVLNDLVVILVSSNSAAAFLSLDFCSLSLNVASSLTLLLMAALLGPVYSWRRGRFPTKAPRDRLPRVDARPREFAFTVEKTYL